MIVYRLEHPSHGMGPYSRFEGTDDMRALGELLLDEIGHPCPETDRLLEYYLKMYKGGVSNAFFGCPTLELLQSWFAEFWPWLMELGYKITVYETSDYCLSRSGGKSLLIYGRL